MANTSQVAQLHPDTLSPAQLRKLEEKLREAREGIVQRSRVRVTEALDAPTHLPDESDEATNLAAQAFDLRLADKDRKLLRLIDHALAKLARGDGEFGLCEGTGERISTARLELRPWARYSVAYKDQLERERRLHRDD
jgi:DnaK suppressor protein